MKRKRFLLYLSFPLLALLLYHGVFNAEYAYLDEAQQLWRNQEGSNFTMFFVQGRPLTGQLLEWLFGSVQDIAGLRMIRIFSLVGWILTGLVLLAFLERWIRDLLIDQRILLPAMVLFTAAPATAISIGWASCAEIFLATLAGLVSGALVFNSVFQARGKKSLPALILAIACGVVSLFLYQNSFGIFLLPFVLLLFAGKSLPVKKMVTAGIIFYLLVYLVYYISFAALLHHYGVHKATRAALSTDLPGKLSFFFSGPAPKAFSLNLLYHTSSIFKQIFAPLMIGLFAVSVYIRYREQGWVKTTGRLLLFLVLLMLVYLPSMAVAENFSSYRTMLPFSLAAGFVLFIQLSWFFRQGRFIQVTGLLLTITMAFIGYLNINRHFLHPVREEHLALKTFLNGSFRKDTKEVLFIRADRQVFRRTFGPYPVKDEFGYASTAREWVPDPLVRQLVMEQTGKRATADSLRIRQFASRKDYEKSGLTPGSTTLLIDMDSLIIRGVTPASGF
ncbi:MAG: hypothetical protein EOO09_00010 [Chitinophagaceae bacterium]|nr:MAG: hypothetical protein EOO09_00010 [Chitinophagaceae bacterium]